MEISEILTSLELTPPVTFQDATEQWRTLIKKYHPDKNSGSKEYEDRFKKVNAAFSYLKEHRALLEDVKPTDMQPSSGFIHTILNVAMEDIYCQRERYVTVMRYIRCSTCTGTGSDLGINGMCSHCDGIGQIKSKVLSMLNGNSQCPICNGAGILGNKCKDCKGHRVKPENINLKMKLDLKHIWYGGEIFRAVGNEDINGKKSDIHVKVVVKSDGRFKIDGDCFTINIPISPVQKLIGDFGFIEVFGKNLKYEIIPQASEFTIYDKRPGFLYTRKIKVVYVEKPPEVITKEMTHLYKQILNLEKGMD